ncbi:hypothetical protein SDC9_208419 [bioreactor metagenome]|uniref:7-cyano-7-deazaguanine synthase n=1 Tax=bioreactor metagenome TaxID=1076179 RepID=A0A645JAK9_9ZZZZ
MASSCADKIILQEIVDSTVSCSHWKRKNKQCGVCVPCIIRQAALLKSQITERVPYELNPANALNLPKRRDDLFALINRIDRTDVERASHTVISNGPLPIDCLADFTDMYVRGIEEVKAYLIHLGIL